MNMAKIATIMVAATISFAGTAGAQTTPPPPVPPAAKVRAMPYLETAGTSDVFEITSSQIALMKSQNPEIRRYATQLINHHTATTNTALAAAKAAGVTPPPPVLEAQFRAMISELLAASPANFDRIYLSQQVPSHQGALELVTAYAEGGDTPQLRQAAAAAAPFVRDHLAEAQRMQVSLPRR